MGHLVGLARNPWDQERSTKEYESLILKYLGPEEVESFRNELAEVSSRTKELRGANAFYLYETFGLPQDFIEEAARDQGVRFDLEGFNRAKEAEQARARASWKGGSKASASPAYQ